jgi:subtilisin-like proprotein convertase family protein
MSELTEGEKHMSSTVNLKGWAAVVIPAVVAACLLALLVATKPADAAGKYRTVTKTFSNPSAISIPTGGAASPYPSAVAAGGMRRGKVLDANVTLNGFSHSYPRDVDVMLVGPGGHNATIMSDVGGDDTTPANNLTLTLDDEAANSLTYSDALSSGAFKPTNETEDFFPAPAPAQSGLVALSSFDRTNPNGTWSLYVADDQGFDGGQFAEGWSLTIRARVLR